MRKRKKGVKATKAVLATILQILQKIEGTVGPIFAASGVLPATYATPPPAFVALTEDSSLPSGTAPCLIGSGISGSSGPSSVVPLSAVQGSLRDNSRSLNSRTGMKAVHGQSKLREVMSMAPNTTSSTAMDLHLDDEIGSQLDIEYEEENSQPQHGLVGARTAQCKCFGHLRYVFRDTDTFKTFFRSRILGDWFDLIMLRNSDSGLQSRYHFYSPHIYA